MIDVPVPDPQPESTQNDETSAEDVMLHCPVCSTKLDSRKCKLFCPLCGYYMSCADYY